MAVKRATAAAARPPLLNANCPRQTETVRWVPAFLAGKNLQLGTQVKDDIVIAQQMHPRLMLTNHPRAPTTTSLETKKSFK